MESPLLTCDHILTYIKKGEHCRNKNGIHYILSNKEKHLFFFSSLLILA